MVSFLPRLTEGTTKKKTMMKNDAHIEKVFRPWHTAESQRILGRVAVEHLVSCVKRSHISKKEYLHISKTKRIVHIFDRQLSPLCMRHKFDCLLLLFYGMMMSEMS